MNELENNRKMPTIDDLDDLLRKQGKTNIAEGLKHARKHSSLLTDEFQSTNTIDYKEALRIFIRSCDGLNFTSRHEVLHTLINKIDSHLIEHSYKLLIKELENNMDFYNNVFAEFGIYTIPSIK